MAITHINQVEKNLNKGAPLPEPSDQELIAGINAGDERDFGRLYLRHRDWVFRSAWRICGDSHLAQDVAQEVFRYFLGKFPGFELRCQLRTFLYPAVRNLSLASLRGQRRFVGGEAAEAVMDRLAGEENSDPGNHDLHRMLEGLSLNHREILLMRFVDGMTVPEIAEMTGIPLGTAKSRLHHAISILRGEIELENFLLPVNDLPGDRTLREGAQ